jgi:DNA-binding MarR family transcriptional regulator
MNTKHEQQIALEEEMRGLGAAFSTLELLNVLRDATQQDAEAQVLVVFLLIAQRPEKLALNILEVARVAGIAESSASRIVATLGRGLRGKPGAGLVETREDPTNYSRKLIFLSPKGQRVVERLGEIWKKGGNTHV